MIKQKFIIVSRNINNEIKVEVCKDFLDVCATQLGLLVGSDKEIAKNFINEENAMQIKKHLEQFGRDRVANDEEEVYIFLLPEQSKMR